MEKITTAIVIFESSQQQSRHQDESKVQLRVLFMLVCSMHV